MNIGEAQVAHYGATLPRAYEREKDRVKYRSVTLVATLLLAVVFRLSLEFHLLGTLVANYAYDLRRDAESPGKPRAGAREVSPSAGALRCLRC